MAPPPAAPPPLPNQYSLSDVISRGGAGLHNLVNTGQNMLNAGFNPANARNDLVNQAMNTAPNYKTLGEYDAHGMNAPNDPRNSYNPANWEQVNGNLPFPTNDWQHTGSSDWGYYGNSLPADNPPPLPTVSNQGTNNNNDYFGPRGIQSNIPSLPIMPEMVASAGFGGGNLGQGHSFNSHAFGGSGSNYGSNVNRNNMRFRSSNFRKNYTPDVQQLLDTILGGGY